MTPCLQLIEGPPFNRGEAADFRQLSRFAHILGLARDSQQLSNRPLHTFHTTSFSPVNSTTAITFCSRFSDIMANILRDVTVNSFS